jgi:Tol biopolymer transport system component
VTDYRARLEAALASRYTIERELGSGGMATVYLAEDLRHHRKVAVKVLRPEIAASLGSDRFFREIEVAARLQHPHILPLLDSGEGDGFYYYVMPYISGESLRDRLARHGELPIHDAVRILVEVVDALAAAHGEGVVHRDIKPDNVMLSGRHALVTDFGVAKAVSEATGRQQLTTAGVALGTPSYMAPEQAVADPHLDHRVDIYAVGVMAYEMLTGNPPFHGRSAQEILAAQVTQAPEPITSRREAVPQSLALVIMKCLEKRPADRWQSAEELLGQLEVLSTPTAGMTPTQTRPLTAVKVSRSFPRWAAWALGGAVVAGGAFALSLRQAPPPTLVLGKRMAVAATPEWEVHPSLSPDGRMLSYTSLGLGTSRLLLRQADGGNPVVVNESGFSGVFSPDGTRLLILVNNNLSVMPALGGQARVIARGTAWGSWSPDGRAVVYTRGDTLFEQSLDSTRGTPLNTSGQSDLHSPAWSSDGQWIAYVEGNTAFHLNGNLAPTTINIVPATGNRPPVAITQGPSLNTSPVWIPGRRALLFISDRDGGRDIYQVELKSSGEPLGAPVRLTTGLDAEWISLSADGRRLAWSQFRGTSNVWSLPIPAGDSVPLSRAAEVTSGAQTIETIAVSPDGQWLYYDSDRTGSSELYRMRLSGGSLEQLTNEPAGNFSPAVSPDGKELAFHSLRTGNRDIFVIPASGGEAIQITRSPEQDMNPSWAPDGQHLTFDEQRRPDSTLWIASRNPDRLWSVAPFPHRQGGAIPRWSPDGRWIAAGGGGLFEVATGQARRLFALDRGPGGVWSAWSEDSRTLYFARPDSLGVLKISAVSINGGQPRTLAYADAPLRQQYRFGFAVSKGRIYFVLMERKSDVWVAEVEMSGNH